MPIFHAGTNAPTRGDCDLSINASLSASQIAGTNAPTRGDCDNFNLDRRSIARLSRNECPDQRGLRLDTPQEHYQRTVKAGTNAPTRGDCDWKPSEYLAISGKAGTNAPTRGDCDKQASNPRTSRALAGTNAPTRGDCDTPRFPSAPAPTRSRNECPDQRGLRLFIHRE